MKRVVVLLAEGCEEIEAITPIDVLRRAGVEVFTVGLGSTVITGSHNIELKADADSGSKIMDQEFDGIIIPGGMPGSQNISDSEPLLELIKAFFNRGKLVASICAAPGVVLGKCGILEGRKFTCYPGFEDRVTGGFFSEERVVVDGNIITSRGPGTALEFSMALVKYLVSNEKAETLAKGMLLP